MPTGKGRSLNQLKEHSYSYTNPNLSNKKCCCDCCCSFFLFTNGIFFSKKHHRPVCFGSKLYRSVGNHFPNSVGNDVFFYRQTSPCWYGNSFPRLSPFLGKSMISSWWMNLLPVPCHRRIAPAAFAVLPLETWEQMMMPLFGIRWDIFLGILSHPMWQKKNGMRFSGWYIWDGYI